MTTHDNVDDSGRLSRLGQLAERAESTARWEDLTLPKAECERLREIARRMKDQRSTADGTGYSVKASLRAGVTALFAGPSSPDKVAAAAAIANHVNCGLYRVDLRRVVSQFIGETEKNLHRVCEEAELSGGVLLFEEGDALFGKRTEVTDSHDRYANLETADLLKRLEAYSGLAILSSNSRSAIEETAVRRFDYVIEFIENSVRRNR